MPLSFNSPSVQGRAMIEEALEDMIEIGIGPEFCHAFQIVLERRCLLRVWKPSMVLPDHGMHTGRRRHCRQSQAKSFGIRRVSPHLSEEACERITPRIPGIL